MHAPRGGNGLQHIDRCFARRAAWRACRAVRTACTCAARR
jgi:hypothetical protein